MKQKNLSRRDFLRLAGGSAAGVLIAGCQAKTVAVEGTPKATEKVAKAATATPVPVTESVTLRVVAAHNVESFLEGQNENDNAIIHYLEEKSGFELEWFILPGEDANTKLNLLLADTVPPDILMTGSFADLLFQEALADITEYVKESTTLQSFVPEDAWAPATVDGRIYAVPVPQNQYIAGSNGVFVRRDWFDELGIETPVTLDDYYDTMKRLKDEKGVIPLTGSGSRVPGFTGAFGIATQYIVKDGQLVDGYVQPEAKSYLEYMNKLYTEGLIDPEWPVNQGGNIQEKVVAEGAAMSVVGWWSALSIDKNFKDRNPGGELVYIAPPTGPNGEFGVERHGPVRNYVMVPAQSKHIKEAVQFIDLMCQEETRTFVAFGEENVHFERRDGEVYLLPEYQNRRWQMYYLMVDTQDAFAVRLRDKGFKVYSDQVASFMVVEPIASYAPPMTEVIEVRSDIESTVDEYFMQFIVGDLGFDKWDEYVQAWKDAGGEQAQAALNDWYQNNYK